MVTLFFKPKESLEQKKDRLLGQYPHNTWCPECLKRMADSGEAVLIGEQLLCNSTCSRAHMQTTRKNP